MNFKTIRHIHYVCFLLCAVNATCTQKPTLSEEVRANFEKHVAKVDSALILDSFRILLVDTLTHKKSMVRDDTIYKQEFARVQSQLDNALANNMKDSIMIYRYELNYMVGQIDSLTHSIPSADTVKKFGVMIRCLYQLRKNGRTVIDSVPYVFDKKMYIRNPHYIDSMIAKSYRRII